MELGTAMEVLNENGQLKAELTQLHSEAQPLVDKDASAAPSESAPAPAAPRPYVNGVLKKDYSYSEGPEITFFQVDPT